jgi:acetoin utilization deacetylase AcuC-like enzyme
MRTLNLSTQRSTSSELTRSRKRRASYPTTPPIKPSIIKAVKLIVGAALKAGDLVAQEKVRIAQGVGGGLHHSGRDYGEVWCVFNDVAICAEAMVARHKKSRVLILDTDAHAARALGPHDPLPKHGLHRTDR